MSRLRIETPDQAQLTVERLYKDLERHIIASPPGLCPVDLQLSFLKVCHAQTCGKCVPCRVGLAQLQNLMEDVLAGKADMHTLDLIESTAQNVANSADCAIGFEAAKMVLAGLEGFREDYINHIKKGKCSVNVHHSIPALLCARHRLISPVTLHWLAQAVMPTLSSSSARITPSRLPAVLSASIPVKHAAAAA